MLPVPALSRPRKTTEGGRGQPLSPIFSAVTGSLVRSTGQLRLRHHVIRFSRLPQACAPAPTQPLSFSYRAASGCHRDSDLQLTSRSKIRTKPALKLTFAVGFRAMHCALGGRGSATHPTMATQPRALFLSLQGCPGGLPPAGVALAAAALPDVRRRRQRRSGGASRTSKSRVPFCSLLLRSSSANPLFCAVLFGASLSVVSVVTISDFGGTYSATFSTIARFATRFRRLFKLGSLERVIPDSFA